jgi:hypothetical protein
LPSITAPSRIIFYSDLMEKSVVVPWWNGLPLRPITYNGPDKQPKP